MANRHFTREYSTLPQTRRAAKERGAKKYFTGLPCANGHIAPKYTSKGSCVECLSANSRKPERIAYERAYYEANKDRISERSRRYVKRNLKDVLARVQKWQKDNPRLVREYKRNNKAARRAAIETGVTGSALAAWVSSQDKVCYWCGDKCESSFHVDHYEPLAKGGKHELENLVIACASCNLRKNAKDPLEFAQEVGRLF